MKARHPLVAAVQAVAEAKIAAVRKEAREKIVAAKASARERISAQRAARATLRKPARDGASRPTTVARRLGPLRRPAR